MSANPPADAGAIFEVGARAEAERSGHPFLEYQDGARRTCIVVLGPTADAVTVGRRSSCDLALGWDDEVSRLHARLERLGGVWQLVDDGLSSNGTFINDRRLHGSSPLRDGDVMRFGSTRMTFHAPYHAPPPHRAPTPPQTPTPPQAPAAQAPAAQAPAAQAPAAQAPAAQVELSSTQRRVLVSLCRPYKGGNRFATPASDEQIAEDLVLSVREVRTHLRVLCAKLGIDGSGGSSARVRLAEAAFAGGLVSDGDL